ncbi:MAG TPA: recombination mediator RecR [Candidatus Tectomicrobia bacterium]|nr:recombination mediator RecR [Candidatus Tectomicrobia bacterium]
MVFATRSVTQLIEELMRLPGVGEKTAQRLAFHLLKTSKHEAEALAMSILAVKEKIRRCSQCFGITEADLCPICSDPKRDRTLLSVVEEPRDIFAFEKLREYRGLYHVLGGALSPLEGIGPEDLTIPQLLTRLRAGETEEVIVATNPNLEGEATAMYLSKVLKPLAVRVTRLAHGLPIGSALEYADEVTLLKSLEGRREL